MIVSVRVAKTPTLAPQQLQPIAQVLMVFHLVFACASSGLFTKANLREDSNQAVKKKHLN